VAGPSPTLRPTITPAPTLALPPITDLATTPALRIPSSPNPDWIAVADGTPFVFGVGGESDIARLDPITGAVVSHTAVEGGACQSLGVGFGSVWTVTCDAPGIVRLNAASAAVEARIVLDGRIPTSEASLGVGEGAVWVVVQRTEPTLVKVDPTTNVEVGAYPVPGGATAVRAGEGGIWVLVPPARQLLRVDPASGAVVATIGVGALPTFLAVGLGGVWVMNQVDGSVSHVDPATNAVVATIDAGPVIQGGDIAVGGGSVWLRGSEGYLAARIDPATDAIVERFGPASGSGSVAADDDAVWFTAHDVRAIWRLPLR
jgi:YVTN family beta-propeller protein